MKICMILPSLSTGGTERVVVNLSEYLAKNQHEVHIIIFKDIVKFKLNKNIKLHILKKKNSKELKILVASLESENKPFDYIYSHSLGNILKKANLHDRYYIFHNPISIQLNQGSFISKFIRKIKLKHRYDNENIVTVSDGLKDDLLEHGFKPKSINTIYNPFDFEHIKNEADKDDSSIPNEEYIIHVARFHHQQKRHDILLKAFSKSNLSCKLLLVGDGSIDETQNIKNIITQLDLQDKVIIIGNKSNPFPLIKNAKLLVLSSDFEGLPMVLIESLILDTPTVSTNCKSGPSEIMLDNLSNYLVPTGDINILAKKIKEAFLFPPKINQSNIEKFHIKKITEKYLNLKKQK